MICNFIKQNLKRENMKNILLKKKRSCPRILFTWLKLKPYCSFQGCCQAEGINWQFQQWPKVISIIIPFLTLVYQKWKGAGWPRENIAVQRRHEHHIPKLCIHSFMIEITILHLLSQQDIFSGYKQSLSDIVPIAILQNCGK